MVSREPETHWTDGLLRSMVLVPEYRSKGFGVAVLRVIEAMAAEQGIARLHLLTTTASGFFEQQGYAVNQRGSAPPMISQTEQFRGALPWLGLLHVQSVICECTKIADHLGDGF